VSTRRRFEVTVKSSAPCGGEPATIIGGCNVGRSGPGRRIDCQRPFVDDDTGRASMVKTKPKIDALSPQLQGTELRAIVRLATFVAIAHQPRLLQNPEMLRDGRLRDPGPRRQGPDRLLTFAAQPLEDGPSRRIGERSEKDSVGLRHRN
jgi:hypothetical protein